MTYSQRVALGGLKILFYIVLAAAIVGFIACLPQIMMWILRR